MLNNESVNQLENQINEFYEQLVWSKTNNLIDRSDSLLKIPWPNGSASDSRSEGCAFDCRVISYHSLHIHKETVRRFSFDQEFLDLFLIDLLINSTKFKSKISLFSAFQRTKYKVRNNIQINSTDLFSGEKFFKVPGKWWNQRLIKKLESCSV